MLYHKIFYIALRLIVTEVSHKCIRSNYMHAIGKNCGSGPIRHNGPAVDDNNNFLKFPFVQ